MTMKEKPCVSMIMPVYNAEAYLEESIRSVMEQSYAEWELLLVDDSSTDHSLQICQAMAGKDARIRVIALEENVGAGYARNEGIQQAAGKYLTFVDADDAVDPAILENAVTLAEHHDLDWVVWGLREEYYDPQGKKQHERTILPEDRCYPLAMQARQAMIGLEEKTLFGYQWNKLYRTEIIQEEHVFFENAVLYEDFFFNVAYAKRIQSMGTLAQAGYCYKKRNQDSVTASFVAEYFELSWRRVQEMTSLYKEWRMLGKRERDILGNIYLRCMMSALARNCDPRAQMNGRERSAWIRKRYADSLYQEVGAKCRARKKEYRLTQMLLNQHWTLALRGLGRGLYIVQHGCRTIFVKEKTKG